MTSEYIRHSITDGRSVPAGGRGIHVVLQCHVKTTGLSATNAGSQECREGSAQNKEIPRAMSGT